MYLHNLEPRTRSKKGRKDVAVYLSIAYEETSSLEDPNHAGEESLLSTKMMQSSEGGDPSLEA